MCEAVRIDPIVHRKSFRFNRQRNGDRHGYNRYEGIVGKAKAMLRDGLPLPVDMQMQLLEIGVDLEDLENLYG